MPFLAKARPTADNCGWCQQGHATVKIMPNKIMQIKNTKLHTGSVVTRVYNDRHRHFRSNRMSAENMPLLDKLQRRRGGRKAKKKRELRKTRSVDIRVGTLNVGSMTGKGREVVDLMSRRRIDILCVQETRWKGAKSRNLGGGFKLFYYGEDSKRNGIGVIIKEEYAKCVVEVKRVSDRIMMVNLVFEGVMINVISAYAPQVGCEMEHKLQFWNDLDEVMHCIDKEERVVIGADLNGHVGDGNNGDEHVMGKFGFKERNEEGQMIVDFAKRMEMAVVNTYFKKREEHRVTYKSGGRSTQIDYILCKRSNLKECGDCKVIPGESVAKQHRVVICKMTVTVKKRKKVIIEPRIRWWKLKEEDCCVKFKEEVKQALNCVDTQSNDWNTMANAVRESARNVLGMTSGKRKENRETWWWNEEVQDSIKEKKLAKKNWDTQNSEESRQAYKQASCKAKRDVAKAYDELYMKLDTKEGEKDLYKLVKVLKRWKNYYEEMMNRENERETRIDSINGTYEDVPRVTKEEVRTAMKKMKNGKAVGPDDIPVEAWKCLGELAIAFLTKLFNGILESESMPSEWRRSVLVPIFKNKGDVMNCGNYRSIKLLSHSMKLWERVIEARLRQEVEICEQQYGFMPGKSTTDPMFALRLLMEKYIEGQKKLHCVFVDLEKAYGRVPREELWYCMRKSGMSEKYVRMVQDMYKDSVTAVRCATGMTEAFKVKVGLHQGSALSPLLFAIVIDRLTDEVREPAPWTMIYADDIVICSESRENVETKLEKWRYALERRGMKVSRSKTEYTCINDKNQNGKVKLHGSDLEKVNEFKYLGSTVHQTGDCTKEVKKRIQAGWCSWRKVTEVLCDKRISAKVKGKIYKTVVRPAMLYGLETAALTKRHESEIEVAELRMLRFSLGVTRKDKIRNE